MRYIARYVRPKYGPVLGTTQIVIRDYASDRTALRYLPKHLEARHLPSGQYEVRTFPYHQQTDRLVGHLYKR